MQELRKHIEHVVPLTDEEFAFALSFFSIKHFRKHQIVVHEGDFVNYDFFVLRGLMRSLHPDSDGKEHIIQFASENCWITDPEAFHHGTKATLNIDCLEETKVLAISSDAREQLCRDLHKFEYFFNKKTTVGYITLQKRILCLISSTASKRYDHLIKQYPELMQRVPKSMIASYLGVSRETLSRLSSVGV